MAPVTPANPNIRPILTPQEWERQKRIKEFKRVLPQSGGSNLQGIQIRPPKVWFATQNPGEEIFILLRKHWSKNWGWMISTFFYGVLPLILLVIAGNFRIFIWEYTGITLFLIIFITYYSFLLGEVVKSLADWYYNLYIVTNERVIDYDFNVLKLGRGASETSLESIEDVKETSAGLFASLFNFGDVSIFSAADRNVIVFDDIPDPTFVRDKVSDLSKIAKSRYTKPQ